MTEQDKKNIKKFCQYLAENWINGKYNQSYVTIGIDKDGILKSIETKKSIMEDFKKKISNNDRPQL